MVRRKHIRTLVEKLLKSQNIRSEPVRVKSLAKNLGIQVQEQTAEDGLSGFLYRDRNRNLTIIGVNVDHHENRQNFTAAHELGHFFLHDFDQVHFDRSFKVWRRDEKSSDGTNLEEREANLFAAELLMPAKFLEESINELGSLEFEADEIKQLAKRYEVSVEAMTIRLTSLGYLDS